MFQAALSFILLGITASIAEAASASGVTTEFGHFVLLVFLVLAFVNFWFGVATLSAQIKREIWNAGRKDEQVS